MIHRCGRFLIPFLTLRHCNSLRSASRPCDLSTLSFPSFNTQQLTTLSTQTDDPSTIPLVLQGIHYRRLTDLSLLISALYSLPTWLSSHPEVSPSPSPSLLSPQSTNPCAPYSLTTQVRLLILDSLSSHYRPASLSTSTKTLFLNLLRSTLTLLTTSYNITVRFSPLSLLSLFPPFARARRRSLANSDIDAIEQVIATTFLSIKMFTPQGVPTTFSHDSLALLVPQMGDTWLPSSSNSNGGGGATVECWRVVLYFDERGERYAFIF